MASDTQTQDTSRRMATSSVYERIKLKILRNEIAPATRINIDKLARELEVSPTPVREALKQLQGDNLVLQELGRGYSTTPLLNLNELRAMFEFRLLVEPWAAKVASQDRLRNPGHLLQRQLADLETFMQAAPVRTDPDVRYELVEHDTLFHDAILGSIDNELLRTAYSQTHCHLHAFRLYPNDHTGARTIVEHHAVAKAIRDREPDAAEAAMREHLLAAYTRYAEGHTAPPGIHLPGVHPERPMPNTNLTI